MLQPTTNPILPSELTLYRFNGTAQLVEIPYTEVLISWNVLDFCSSLDGYLRGSLDWNQQKGNTPTTTYFAHASGGSRLDADLQDGDLIIFDTAAPWGEGDVVICHLNGSLTAKRVERRRDGRYFLVSSNPKFKPVELKEESEILVLGPMTGLSRQRNRIIPMGFSAVQRRL